MPQGFESIVHGQIVEQVLLAEREDVHVELEFLESENDETYQPAFFLIRQSK